MAYLYQDNLKEKTEYLRILYSEESDRQGIIESKHSQLLGQSGIILSLVGLFIPMYLDKLITSNICFQICLIIIFLTTLLFYFLTIFKSSKYLNADKYDYKRKVAGTVNRNFTTLENFNKEEISDLLEIIEINSKINNSKVEDLKWAYRYFRAANIFTAVLSLLLLSSMFFVSEERPIPEHSLSQPSLLQRK